MARLIRQLAGLVLYVLTFALDIPGALCRLVLTYVVATTASWFLTVAGLGGLSGRDAGTLALIAAAWPLVASLLALILPSGRIVWRRRNGGRTPSAREQERLDEALAEVRSADAAIKAPSHWFVVDAGAGMGAVCRGTTLLIERELLWSPYLSAVLAHELGHLRCRDARLVAALSRLVIREREKRLKAPLVAGALAGGWLVAFFIFGLWVLYALVIQPAFGGLGLRLTRPLWDVYWRSREYAADAFAAQFGKSCELAEYLESHALFFDVGQPHILLNPSDYPPVEKRIERLTNVIETPPNQDRVPLQEAA